MKPGEIDTLGQEFVTAVIAARDAYGAGNVPAHNRWFRRSDRAAQKLIAARTERAPWKRSWAMRSQSFGWRLRVMSSNGRQTGRYLSWRTFSSGRSGTVWGTFFGEALQVILNVHGLLAKHYGISVLDVDARVFGSRGLPLPWRKP